jgi:hypothetical protein
MTCQARKHRRQVERQIRGRLHIQIYADQRHGWLEPDTALAASNALPRSTAQRKPGVLTTNFLSYRPAALSAVEWQRSQARFDTQRRSPTIRRAALCFSVTGGSKKGPSIRGSCGCGGLTNADRGNGPQAKTLSKGQIEAVLGYLARTRWPNPEPCNLSRLSVKPTSKGDSQSDLEDGHRFHGPDRSCNPLGERGKQGPVRSGHTNERDGAGQRVREVGYLVCSTRSPRSSP